MYILESYDLELILVIKIKVLQFRSGVELLEQFLHGNKIVPMHAIYGFFGCSYFKKIEDLYEYSEQLKQDKRTRINCF